MLRENPPPPAAMRSAAIIFDMGDIFFDATAWRRSLVRHLQRRGANIDYPAMCRRWEAKLVNVYLGRRPYWEAFEELLADLGLARCQRRDHRFRSAESRRSRKTEVIRRRGGNACRPEASRPEAGGSFRHRKPRVSVRERLAELDIERYFDAVVASIDIGHVKPEPEAFAAALARLDVAAKDALFVGHNVDELEGAKRCGLTTVAFNHDAGVVADVCIVHFAELSQLVGG